MGAHSNDIALTNTDLYIGLIHISSGRLWNFTSTMLKIKSI